MVIWGIPQTKNESMALKSLGEQMRVVCSCNLFFGVWLEVPGLNGLRSHEGLQGLKIMGLYPTIKGIHTSSLGTLEVQAVGPSLFRGHRGYQGFEGRASFCRGVRAHEVLLGLTLGAKRVSGFTGSINSRGMYFGQPPHIMIYSHLEVIR